MLRGREESGGTIDRPASAPTAAAADAIVGRLDRMPFTGLHRRYCGLISAGSFFDSFDSFLLASAIAVVVTVLHIGFFRVGLLISVGNFGMMIGAPCGGWLAEKFGRKPMLVAAVAGFGALSVAAAFAWDFDSLAGIRLVQGLALGAEVPVAAAFFNEMVPGRRRGRAFLTGFGALFAAGFFFAPLVGLACLALFGPALGWRALFASGGVALLVAIVMHYVLPESPRWLADKGRIAEADEVVASFEASAEAEGKELPGAKPGRYGQGPATRLAELFGRRYRVRTILSWIVFFVTYFVAYGIGAWLPTLYVKVGGLPADRALWLAVVFGLTQVVMPPCWGTIADRIGRRAMFTIAFAILVFAMGGGVLALASLHLNGWPVLAGVAFFAGIGNGGTTPLCYLYTTELFPTRMRAWAVATGTSANRVGTVLAPTAIGALLGGGFGLASVFSMVGLTALIGLVSVVALAPETSHGALEDVSA